MCPLETVSGDPTTVTMSSRGDVALGKEGPIRILHVDDDPALAEMAAEFLCREHDQFDCTTEVAPEQAIERLREESFDCVVSDYDMPRMDGLEFLEAVRDENPELPFILFTGKGSEEIASEAIASGVTGYLQKEGNVEHYTVLANRIINAVTQYRTEQKIEQTQQKFRKLAKHSTDVVQIVDETGEWQYLSPSSDRILGYEPADLIGDIGFDYIHPEDRQEAIEQFSRAIEDPNRISSVEFRFDHSRKDWVWLENHARNMVDDPVIDGFIVHTREITDRKRHAQELQRQNERLEKFMRFISHDLRSPLSVVVARNELARAECESEHLEAIETAADRMEEIIDGTLAWARSGKVIDEVESVELSEIAGDSWANVATADAELHEEGSTVIRADPDRLKTLFENLFRNSLEHGSTGRRTTGEDHHADDASLTVRVGTLENGFYVADDGPGIPASDRDVAFESNYSSGEGGVGLGLTICREIAEAHGWTISITDGEDGGARIELTGVETRTEERT